VNFLLLPKADVPSDVKSLDAHNIRNELRIFADSLRG